MRPPILRTLLKNCCFSREKWAKCSDKLGFGSPFFSWPTPLWGNFPMYFDFALYDGRSWPSFSEYFHVHDVALSMHDILDAWKAAKFSCTNISFLSVTITAPTFTHNSRWQRMACWSLSMKWLSFRDDIVGSDDDMWVLTWNHSMKTHLWNFVIPTESPWQTFLPLNVLPGQFCVQLVPEVLGTSPHSVRFSCFWDILTIFFANWFQKFPYI